MIENFPLAPSVQAARAYLDRINTLSACLEKPEKSAPHFNVGKLGHAAGAASISFGVAACLAAICVRLAPGSIPARVCIDALAGLFGWR